MVKFWAICRNTFVQTIRQPIYGVLIFVTFAVLVMDVPLSAWTMGAGEGEYQKTDQKMLENLGLSTLLMSGLLVAAFSASSALSREIEDKTALTVISKPVARGTFVLGKFAGVAAAVAVAFYLCGLVFLMTVRHQVMSSAGDPLDMPVIFLGLGAFVLALLTAGLGNYFFGWSFISATVLSSLAMLSVAMGLIAFIGKGWQIVPIGHDVGFREIHLVLQPQLFVGMALIFMAVMILVAAVVAASTRVGQVMALLICLGFFFVGSIHPRLFGRYADTVPVARVLGWVVPNLTFFYPLDALTADKHIPTGYLGLAVAYCACYVAALVAVGMALFQTRQLEAESSSATMPGAVGLLAWSGRVAAVAMAITALVLFSQPGFHTVHGIVGASVLLVSSVAAWKLWGSFGRGTRWSYWVVCVLALGVLAQRISALLAPTVALLRYGSDAPMYVVAGIALSAMVLLILVLPRTRRHFRYT